MKYCSGCGIGPKPQTIHQKPKQTPHKQLTFEAIHDELNGLAGSGAGRQGSCCGTSKLHNQQDKERTNDMVYQRAPQWHRDVRDQRVVSSPTLSERPELPPPLRKASNEARATRQQFPNG
jgi:hypothetical protein